MEWKAKNTQKFGYRKVFGLSITISYLNYSNEKFRILSLRLNSKILKWNFIDILYCTTKALKIIAHNPVF